MVNKIIYFKQNIAACLLLTKAYTNHANIPAGITA